MNSSIFSADTGFGGNGNGSNNNWCITNGPFVDYKNPIGPGYKLNDHCISRQINDGMSLLAASSVVDQCMNQTTFLTFWFCVETFPHAAGHGGVGADVR